MLTCVQSSTMESGQKQTATNGDLKEAILFAINMCIDILVQLLSLIRAAILGLYGSHFHHLSQPYKAIVTTLEAPHSQSR